MLRRKFSIRFTIALSILCLGLCLGWIGFASPANADTNDLYLRRYLKVTDSVPIPINDRGETRLFSPDELHEGKELFKEHCLNCHVGGSTLPYPQISLSLNDLKGATPPRDNVSGIVEYLRYPMSYDGSEETYWCREIPPSWMPTERVENIAAFIIRAAQEARGWGTEKFEDI